jgi:hypothetical protein
MDPTTFYVESEDGKIAYKCSITDQGDHCTCGDFATKSKSDPNFKCKHILAVLNSIPRNEVLETQFLDKRKPKLCGIAGLIPSEEPYQHGCGIDSISIQGQ